MFFLGLLSSLFLRPFGGCDDDLGWNHHLAITQIARFHYIHNCSCCFAVTRLSLFNKVMAAFVVLLTNASLHRRHSAFSPNIAHFPKQQGVRIEDGLVFVIHAFRFHDGSFNIIVYWQQLLESVQLPQILRPCHGLVMLPAVVLQICLHSEEAIHDFGNLILCLISRFNELGFFGRRLRSSAFFAFGTGCKIQAAAIKTLPL
mmetsp:Transcript_35530/g.66187  ORF Transcript_35530/g.66187 Transcript_35530/m.66187 type:complete len:202 (-) Transcript_35530:447-1052(-)